LITGRLSALISLIIFLIATIIIVANYSLIYSNKKSYIEQDMKNYAANKVHQINDLLAQGKSIDLVVRETISNSYVGNSETPFFFAFIDSDRRIIGANSLPNNFNIAKYLPKNSVLTNFGEDDEIVFMTTAINSPQSTVMLCGFTKASLSDSIFNTILYFSLWVFGFLGACVIFLISYFRFKIDKPLQYIFHANLREFVGGIISASADCQKLNSIEKTPLPDNLKSGILEAFGMLQKWSCYKIHFDEFLTMTVAESNKQQLAHNIFLAVEADFFVKNMTIFEINHSLNRFEPIMVGHIRPHNTPPEEMLTDPSYCLSYRTGSRVVVDELKKSACAVCKAGESETILCKPMMSSGKQTGVIKFTLDNQKIIANDATNSSFESKVRFLESYLRPYVDLTALTISNINMLNAYKNQVLTDALTNLYNRRYITEYLYSLLNIAKRKESPLSVFMIDIDNFKRFNDEYGHKIGDTVLKIVARTIKESVRDGDTTARYGGEEFIVVLPYSDIDAAFMVGERVRSAVEKIEWNEFELPNIPPVTISLGIASYPLHGYSHYHLTNAADKALYKAKREGKNRVVVHDIKERQPEEPGFIST